SQITQDNRRTGQLVEDKKRIFSAYIDKPYVRKTALRVFLWRLRTAYSVWKGAAGGRSRKRIAEVLSPLCFYALLPAVVAADLLGRAVSRIRAIGHIRQITGSGYLILK
ncbi:MAG: hypothetical protein Q8L40_05995, partial [Burkholderiales bacterium]|nr:hypothetical protein [Burkholderiales bacterium]